VALLDTLKDRQDNKYISFWGLVSNIIAVDEERSDSSYASNETYPTVVEALLRLKLHEKVRYFIYDPDDFTFSQIDEPETDEAKLFLKILLPKSGKKLAPTEVIEIQNRFKNYFWLKESIEQVLPNGIVDFTNPLFFGAGELRPLEMNSSLINAASLIELQRLQERVDELEAEKSNGSFAMGTPTVSHDELRTNEQLIKELADANAKIERQDQEINRLNKHLTEQAQKATEDKELPYNSQMGVARMLYGILKEHKYDITATRGKANELIENASQIHGTPITRNFIAKWIELANQAKSDSTK
tara:strand:- start:14702 stop:15604 length:903 start_codon:yes stop_codon:yes gene_type:complete